MTVEKTLIRSHVFNEIGNKTEDLLERFRAELKEAEGVTTGIKLAGTALDGILAQIDQEIEAHKLDLEQGALAKGWIVRAVHSLSNVMSQANNKTLIARGRVEATQYQLTILKQSYDVEKKRLETYSSPPQADNVIPLGGKERPLPLKARRMQEETQGELPKKRRGRKPKPLPTEAADTGTPSESQPNSMPPGPYKEEAVSTEETS